MNTLITGGLGYIGSNISKILGSNAIVLDNLSNSHLEYKRALPLAKVYICDLNINNLNKIFKKNEIDSVIHLAGLKSVNDSLSKPLAYYNNNVVSSLELLESMSINNVKKLVFSSSATVYGNINKSPIGEDAIINPVNTYGSTKMIIEKLLSDYSKSDDNFSAVSLRYFNPIGSDNSGLLIDNPKGKVSNIMPQIIKATKGSELNIYGNDYPTHDGTCIRDYIHVLDLSNAHLKALKFCNSFSGHEIFNIGTGRGVSVMELIKTFEEVNNLKVNYSFKKRRRGDVAICFASTYKSRKVLDWKCEYNLKQMCKLKNE